MQGNVRLEHELLAVEAEHTVHAMLELVAPPAPAGGERPPLHLALVIDRSGSMGGSKMETTKRCAAFLVQRLAPTDQLALVIYDDDVQLLSPLVPVEPARHLPLIATIEARGSTNLSGGWLKGLEELQRAQGPGARKILLLTDGLANVGITDHDSLVAMAKNAAEADVGTTTIGFGDGFAEELLTAMADAGRGNSYYAGTPDEAPGIFAQEFEGLVSMVAQNVSVEIRPAPEVRMLGVLNDYPAVEVPGGMQIQLGDAYGEDRRRIVFELHIPNMASLGVARVADVIVRYVSVGEQIEAHELTLPIVVNLVSAGEAAAAKPDQDVGEEVVVLKAARAQEEVRELADKGEFDAAQTLLKTAASDLRSRAPGSSKAEELLAQAEQLEGNVAFMSSAAYSSGTRKHMLYQSRQSKRRRK